MPREPLALVALALALVAARITLRRRAVFLLGRHGHRLAPAVLLSLWLAGLLLGQVTHSVPGMGLVAATPLLVIAWLSARHFQPLHARHARWSSIDLAALAYLAVAIFFQDRWDNTGHSAVVAQYLRGNVPPTALNDPRFPLAYHPAYDAVVSLVMTALPVDLEVGMDLVTIGCMALTLTNLQAISRLLFRSPVIAQLGRLLFLCGFGPVFIRYFMEPRNLETMHGRTSQVFVDIMLRRPTSLGFALFTLALAVGLTFCRKRSVAESSRAPSSSRLFASLLPTCLLMPLLSEEATLLVGVLVFALLVRRRLPWAWGAAAACAVAVGAAQSGVVRGVLGQASMATPRFHMAWPPTVPSWTNAWDGVPLLSRDGLMVFVVELGPVFFAAVGLALFGREPRRRLLLLPFAAALVLVVFTRLDNWPKADLDRFLFYTTPPVFMLGASIVERLCRVGATGAFPRGRSIALSIALATFAGVPALAFSTKQALGELGEAFQKHALAGPLRRDLGSVGPRQAVITDLATANPLVESGFLVVAPMTSNSVGQVSSDHFDDYVRDHTHLADWFFLPETDERVKGWPVVSRHGDHVLVRVPAPGPPPGGPPLTAAP